jgi:hypothetical protein
MNRKFVLENASKSLKKTQLECWNFFLKVFLDFLDVVFILVNIFLFISKYVFKQYKRFLLIFVT